MERMTAHGLARLLLSLPDLPVIARNDCIHTEIRGAAVEDEAAWGLGRGAWIEGRAIVLSDEDGARSD